MPGMNSQVLQSCIMTTKGTKITKRTILVQELNDNSLCSTGKLIDNSQVEVCLAKPVDKTEYVRFSRGGSRGGYSGVCMSPSDAELKTGEALLEVRISYIFSML